MKPRNYWRATMNDTSVIDRQVQCNVSATCRRICGAKVPHDCEPCPFHPSAKCVRIKESDHEL